jgi:hypothetical protein
LPPARDSEEQDAGGGRSSSQGRDGREGMSVCAERTNLGRELNFLGKRGTSGGSALSLRTWTGLTAR